MKVLYLIPGLGLGGGAERSLYDVAPGLADAGMDLVIWYQHERSPEARQAFVDLGVRVTKLEARGLWGQVRELHRILRTERPDVLHTTLYEADLVGRLAAVGTPVRVLSSLVNTNYEPARYEDDPVPRWRLEAVRHVEGFTARHLCDRVHANSEAVRAAAVRAFRLRPDQVSVVHRGRDPEPLGQATPARRARMRAELGLPADAPVLVAVGRHEPQKGQIHLVRALPAVLAVHPDAILLVAGREGSSTAELQAELAALGIGDHVRLLGNRADVGDVLSAGDLLAFPSRWEGLPGTIIEAMAVGIPIVASAIPPVVELVDGDRARLVPPADPGALADAILEVLADPAGAAARAQAARQRFEEEFTVAHAREAMVALYRDVAAAPTSRWGARGGR